MSQEFKGCSKLWESPWSPAGWISHSDLFSRAQSHHGVDFLGYSTDQSHLIIMQCWSCSTKPFSFPSFPWKSCGICGAAPQQCSSKPGNAPGWNSLSAQLGESFCSKAPENNEIIISVHLWHDGGTQVWMNWDFTALHPKILPCSISKSLTWRIWRIPVCHFWNPQTSPFIIPKKKKNPTEHQNSNRHLHNHPKPCLSMVQGQPLHHTEPGVILGI